MKIRLNHPDKDRDGSLDHPTMDPAAQQKYANEDEHTQEATAGFPADVGNDHGQFSEDQGNTYPPFPKVTEQAGGEDAPNAAQSGGSGPRVDDLGVDDLQDLPRNNDLGAIDEFTQDIGDRPLFDRSIENIDVGVEEADSETGTRRGRDSRLPQKEDQLADEESEVYDVSIDGPGTRDLH